MIRPTASDDTAGLLTLAVAAGLFAETETEPLAMVLADYFVKDIHEGHKWVTDEADGAIRGVAYYAPAQMTDGTWYVKMIAVQPEFQGQGHGKALMEYVEAALLAAGQRVLLVETSGLPEFERTRHFYVKCGYEQEARIRDYYKAGDDMIVFRKDLTAALPVCFAA